MNRRQLLALLLAPLAFLIPKKTIRSITVRTDKIYDNNLDVVHSFRTYDKPHVVKELLGTFKKDEGRWLRQTGPSIQDPENKLGSFWVRYTYQINT